MLIILKANRLSARSLSSQFFIRCCSSNDKSGTGTPEEKTKNDAKRDVEKCEQPEETAAQRLNRLLASMQTEEDLASLKSISMAKPKGRKKKSDAPVTEEESSEKKNKNVFEAAKKVASLFGETDKKQIESELLTKLLNLGDKTHQKQQKDENDLSLSDLISGMEIEHRPQPKHQSRSDFVRGSFGERIPPHHKPNPFIDDGNTNIEQSLTRSYLGSVNLFGAKPLGIFTDPKNLKDSPDMLKTWAHLYERELQQTIAHPPRNYFEKMIQWTEQGKLWKFPIDNEQGLDEEAKVDFTDHVFLEQYLENWCPTRGPIRHYMELVCVGLSKNPHIAAKTKKEHILWYRDYFNQKKEILKDLLDQEKMELATSSSSAKIQQIKSSDALITDS